MVSFDPTNKEHRAIYHEFVVNRTWGHSPYRFIVPEDQGTDLISMIQRLLIQFYIQKEFGMVARIPDKKIRQKKTKKVDN